MANNDENNEQKSPRNLAKYSAMGFQMIAIIAVFTFAGYKIDAHKDNNQNIWTAMLSLLGVVIALLFVIRQARKL